MLVLILLIIIWTIYIIKCTNYRFYNIGKLDKMWRYDKNAKVRDVIIIE